MARAAASWCACDLASPPAPGTGDVPGDGLGRTPRDLMPHTFADDGALSRLLIPRVSLLTVIF